MIKLIAMVLAALVCCLAITVYVALEMGGVLTVESTNHTTGEQRLTHIWYVMENGQLTLEAGSPENPWVQDLEIQPYVRVSGEGMDGAYRLRVVHGASNHRRIRSLMRTKYGWRDVLIAMMFDTSRSKLVVAEPN